MAQMLRLTNEEEKLKGVLEFYFKEYFAQRVVAIEKSYAENPSIINKDYAASQLKIEIEDLIAECSEKVNTALLLVLDLYTMGRRREVREFEAKFVSLMQSCITVHYDKIAKQIAVDLLK